MSDNAMLTTIDGPMLAEAFPLEHRSAAMSAGIDAARILARRQWTERFAVQVEHQSILIPARLHFASDRLTVAEGDESWRFARALQSRSSDGFERQRSARDLLSDLQPWGAPFILALIGEYIIEILEDISAAMNPEMEETLAAFIVHNEAFWNTTKQRVASYWNVYYRSGWSGGGHRAYRRDQYVGFELIERLGAAVFRRRKMTDK